MKDLEKLKQTYGEVLELLTPSGNIVRLRQQTGEDDDILSNAADSVDGSSFANFVSTIVVDSDITELGTLNVEDVLNLKLGDKYFILISSRIFSIGQIVKFEYTWEGDKHPIPYEEDLGLYIWDYKKKFPEVGDEDYHLFRIPPYDKGKEKLRKITLSTGRKIRYKHNDGHSEKYLISLPLQEQTKNQELIARDIELEINKKWVKVESFKNFTPLEMMEIRNDVEKNDPVMDIFSELIHPTKKTKTLYAIIGSSDFFFPREI